jgi:3-methyladenine DNA glycosylase AlkC
LLSTGLKADVECDDLEADKAMFNRKELDNYNNIYEDHCKDIVFKVYNFKKSLLVILKRKLATI